MRKETIFPYVALRKSCCEKMNNSASLAFYQNDARRRGG